MKWRPVFGGAVIQVCLGWFVLRTDVGAEIFSAMGDFVTEFINCVTPGVEFVYGAHYYEHFFAFKVSFLLKLVNPAH